MNAAVAELPNDNRNNGFRFQFRRAVKRDAKLRFAIAGPGGSGKTYTTLRLATELGGRILVADSEHGSASKYADEFDFDVIELDQFDPDIIPQLIREAAAAGYSSLILDSWSHFWMGPQGELEQVDQISARQRNNNSWSAWRHVSPKHSRMIDAMLSAPLHILVTMRVKTEWVVDKDEKTGKTCPRKVGLQPVMRDGVEYEFDVCGDMDQENNLIVTKSRCPKLTGKMISRPGQEMAAILRDWLRTPEQNAPALDPDPHGYSVDVGPHPYGTQEAQQYVAHHKIEQLHTEEEELRSTKAGEIREQFAKLRERLGEVRFGEEMRLAGIRGPLDFRPDPEGTPNRKSAIEKTRDLYRRLTRIAKQQEVA
jgi:hypothetical protein